MAACDINKQADGEMDRQRQTDSSYLLVCFLLVPLSAHLRLPPHISLCSLSLAQTDLCIKWPQRGAVSHIAWEHSLRTAGACNMFIEQHLHSSFDLWGNNL